MNNVIQIFKPSLEMVLPRMLKSLAEDVKDAKLSYILGATYTLCSTIPREG